MPFQSLERFTSGRCLDFALALVEVLPEAVLMGDYEHPMAMVPRHVLVEHGDVLLDANYFRFGRVRLWSSREALRVLTYGDVMGLVREGSYREPDMDDARAAVADLLAEGSGPTG